MLSRSLIDSLPETEPGDSFNLQTYLDIVVAELDASDSYEL